MDAATSPSVAAEARFEDAREDLTASPNVMQDGPRSSVAMGSGADADAKRVVRGTTAGQVIQSGSGEGGTEGLSRWNSTRRYMEQLDSDDEDEDGSDRHGGGLGAAREDGLVREFAGVDIRTGDEQRLTVEERAAQARTLSINSPGNAREAVSSSLELCLQAALKD